MNARASPPASPPDRLPTPGAPSRADQAFMSSVRAAQVIDRMPGVHASLYLMLAFLVVAAVWATIARVDVITRAEGRVVPDGHEQTIASLEGGILRALHVREGMAIEAGDVVAELDPTRVAAMQNEGRARRLGLLGALARLEAELSGEAPVFPDALAAAPDVIAGETATWQSRRQALQDAQAATERSLALLESELRLAEELTAAGMMPEVEVMRLRRQRSDLVQERQERQNQYRQQASADLVRVRNELAQLNEQLVVRDDVLERTVLRSPVRGLVKNIRVTTEGGVVAPGAPIMEIVPMSGRVLIEAKIAPADIGFVREGQPVTVKLSAYEYNTYGGLRGTIEYISPDALGEIDRGNGETWYRARVRVDDSTLRYRGEPLPVRPGMTGSVEISTSDRTVMSFLLRPVLKSREAFREQ